MEFFNNNDEIQIESEGGYSGFPDFTPQQEVHSDNNPGFGFDNNQYSNWQGQNTASDPFSNYQVDEEEENRINQRRQEEDERKKKLMQKMNDEIRIKQEFRDKGREYHERFRE
jgi:hypothetical protein